MGIAAVVNDEIITEWELQQRVDLVVGAAGQGASPEARQRLRPQILRDLIDETLEIQEAKERGIEATQQEIDDAVANIAASNNMTNSQFETMLAGSGISIKTLRRQVQAQLVWGRFVNRMYGTRLSVGEEVVNATLDRMKANEGQPEMQVAEIVISVDAPEFEYSAQQQALSLYEQLKAGAQFRAVARQFSQAPTAAVGGDLGWIQPGQMAPEVDAILAQMPPGAISQPIRTASGYSIVALIDRRDANAQKQPQLELDLRHIMFPMAAGATAERMADQQGAASAASAELGDCGKVDEVARKHGAESVRNMGVVNVTSLPQQFREAISYLGPGQATPPIQAGEALHIFLVCDRIEKPVGPVSRDDVMAALEQQQLNMLGRRHLRDLRRDANVEIR
ncbi:peptidylprolyl isomerase [Zavarzinia sp. CC-PAN008]|uniref:peptidylprolyl isomerase n=1 Tax=Zavarzinia sp. CC-PAN008 TaxID=3243332 RepID=UPI003F7472D9